MTAPARIREADVTRILNGARKSKYARVRVTLDPNGAIVIDASDKPEDLPMARRNPLDRLLDRT
jgi:hypothetical protein